MICSCDKIWNLFAAKSISCPYSNSHPRGNQRLDLGVGQLVDRAQVAAAQTVRPWCHVTDAEIERGRDRERERDGALCCCCASKIEVQWAIGRRMGMEEC